MKKIILPADYLLIEADDGVLIPLGVRERDGLSEQQLDELSETVNREYMDSGKLRWTGDVEITKETEDAE